VLVKLMAVHQPAQVRILREFIADDQQLHILGSALAHDRERLNQPVDVLVRLDVAGVQDERSGQQETLPHAIDLFRGRHDRRRSSSAL
jgi:hypothetical protein